MLARAESLNLHDRRTPARQQTAIPTLRDALRRHTANAHELLEQSPLLLALLAHPPQLDHYRHYLARQYRLYAHLEHALRNWVAPEWAQTRLVKAGWLLSDLRALGAAADSRGAAVPMVNSHAEALGILYVLEGATLGLRAVRKRLHADHPGLGTAGRFIDGYGAQTSAHWNDFIVLLETLPAKAWPAAVDAASATFRAFHRLLAAPGHD
jgi:heme oxygenase